jgi:HlyD family secretion protein
LIFQKLTKKIQQAEGAVTSAKAQYNMAVKATENQIIQLEAKNKV